MHVLYTLVSLLLQDSLACFTWKIALEIKPLIIVVSTDPYLPGRGAISGLPAEIPGAKRLQHK